MANIYLNAIKDLTTNTVPPLYTCPANSRSIVKSLLVSDDSGSGDTITVTLFDGDPASANSFVLFKTKAVSADETLQLLTEPLVMMESEVLQVTAATADRLYVVASVLEMNREDR